MHQFYFNECLVGQLPCDTLVDLLSNSLKEFNTLKKEDDLQIQKHIVTNSPCSEITISGTSLSALIHQIRDRELKRLAYSVFDKNTYPIDPYFNTQYDDLIQFEYRYKDLNAINLAIVAKNNGFLFTLPVHTDFKKDRIALDVSNGTSLYVDNLHGDVANTETIKRLIQELNSKHLSSLERLKAMLGECKLHKQFEKSFFDQSSDVQESIIVHFQRAKDRNMITPFCADSLLIKDVSTERHTVYELRIFSPIALRIYFVEINSKVFLSSIGFKADNHQSEDIKQAGIRLKSMVV